MESSRRAGSSAPVHSPSVREHWTPSSAHPAVTGRSAGYRDKSSTAVSVCTPTIPADLLAAQRAGLCMGARGARWEHLRQVGLDIMLLVVFITA